MSGWMARAAAGGLAAALMLVPHPAAADMVVIPAAKDNTLYESATGALSNGSGQNFFVGRTSTTTNVARRAVIAFDIAGNVPAGATIDSVSLTLNLDEAPLSPASTSIGLHRLLADWGEGASDPPFQEGGGAASTTGDATWIHTFFDSVLWASAGGDFVATASAARTVAGVGFYSWGPTATLRADVQDWLDNTATNYGWLLLGDEATLTTARGFESLQSLTTANRPALTVEYTRAAATGAGRVPDGDLVPGTPLMVEHAAGGEIRLSWGASCLASDNDYAIYEGNAPFFYSHTMKICSTGGATNATLMPAPGITYYLVVPRNGPREGSYGLDAAGTERPPGVPACIAQEIAACQ